MNFVLNFFNILNSTFFILHKMAISKEKKVEILSKLNKLIKDAGSIVFVKFHSLPVSDSSLVRKELRSKNIGYIVAKKTLIKKALTDGKFSGNIPELPGEIGLVYSSDPLDSSREIYAFQKKLDKKIEILGGVFEGKFLDMQSMVSIAQIPGLKTLQAQFVNLINSPIQRLVIGLNQIADKGTK